jgi:hypothetical protein
MPFTFRSANAVRAFEPPIGCLIGVAHFRSGITLTFDGFFAWGAIRQIEATGFRKASGRVTQSGFEADNVKIVYRYRVDGKEYQGERYRYGQVAGDDGSAQRIIGAFPVGRVIDVYYAASDPSDSVLKVGLAGGDLLLAMFLTPFNLIMLGMWWFARESYHRFITLPVGGAKIIDDGFTTRVRLARVSPVAIAAAVVGGMSTIAMVLIGFTVGTDPPLPAMCIVWAVNLGVALIVYLWTRARVTAPDNDLVIDEAGRRLMLPVTFGRSDAVVIPLDKVLTIEVGKISQGDSSVYTPMLVFSDDDGLERREKLAEWVGQQNAAELVAWLRERLKLPAPKQDAGSGTRDFPGP